MEYYIGIDLGTSGAKLLLVDIDGHIIKEATETYPVLYPQEGWTEQEPIQWVDAVIRAFPALLNGIDKSLVKGISFGGQMHGLVVLDCEDRVIRPCILWNDGRTAMETDYLNKTIGKRHLSELTGNIAFAGFTAPKLLWMHKNEPENFNKIDKIMLPKDYLTYWLTGHHVTDYSDAAGTLLLDVKRKCWSNEMCSICGITVEKLPVLKESYEIVGNIKPDVADVLGLSRSVCIITGAGDNAAAAVGTGTVENGSCNLSLGTSGTLFISSDRYYCDDNNALHSFCHANGAWHLMGCILSAAACRKWWLEDILENGDYDADEEAIRTANTQGIYFLPYLSGERCPHNDVHIRGGFLGLSSTTTRAQMSRSVMEGVLFAIRDCLAIAQKEGILLSSCGICGGGAKSAAWCQMAADILDMPITRPLTEQGPAYGAAILAMVGCGAYPSVSVACDKLVKIKQTLYPTPQSASFYRKKWEVYARLYPALKDIL